MLGSSGHPPLARQSNQINSVRIQSSAYGTALAIVYGTNRISSNLIWYGDFKAVTINSNARSGGKGGGSVNTNPKNVNYYAAVAFGLCEGPIAGIGTVYKGKEIHTLSDLGLTLFTGTTPTQSAWGYLTTNHPGQDLGYEGVAYVAVASSLLDQSGNVPNYNFEVQGILRYNSVPSGQLQDAEPSAMLADILTNPQYGAGLSAAQIGSLGTYHEYCVGNLLFLSPVLDSQQTAVEILKRWLEITNTGAIWSEGVLKTIPYGDTTVSNYGATYVPTLTPLYTLTDDNFIYAEGEDPVQVTRSTPADAFNIMKIEFLNRANNYATEIAQAQDQHSINTNGPRPSQTQSYHEITTPSVAKFVAQVLLQRQLYKRNTYKFKVGFQFILLEPMDIIGLTDSTLGITNYLVRITDVEEDEKGELTMTAEDMLLGTGAAPLYGSQTGSGWQTNYNVDPGNVNTPLIFEAPFLLAAPRDGAEVWFVASGGPNWGGCAIWASTDNATYQQVGVILSAGRQGVLSATFSTGTDPDTVNTCAVDLTVSTGTLQSATTGEADANNTLCYCDGELISFSTATLTGTYQYNLTTYLRRGLYGTAIGAHSTGAVFARLDDAVYKLYVPQDRIGTLLYFKLLSFNIYGYRLQALSAVTTYSFTPIGKNPPPTVTGFTVNQKGITIFFAWTEVADPGLKGYDIRYQAQGTPSWNTATILTQAERGTESTTAVLLPGAYTFMIRARDVLDQLSTTVTSVNFTVTPSSNRATFGAGYNTWTVPANVDVLDVQLVGAGGSGAYAAVALSTPGTPTLGSTAGGSLAATTYYVRVTWTDVVGQTLASTEVSLAVAANNVLTVTQPASPPAAATGWNVYVSSATGTETKQTTSPLAIATTLWTEPTSGLIAGSALPSANTTGFANGISPYSSTFDFLTAPSAPSLSYVAGGALSSRTYNIYSAYTTQVGPSFSATYTSITIPANNLLVVTRANDPKPVICTGWQVYSWTSGPDVVLQSGATPIAFGTTSWTEPSSGLLSSPLVPRVDTSGFEPGSGEGGFYGNPAAGGVGSEPLTFPPVQQAWAKGGAGHSGVAGITVPGGDSMMGSGGDAATLNAKTGAGGAGVSTGTVAASGGGAGGWINLVYPVTPGQVIQMNIAVGGALPGGGGSGGDGAVIITW